MAGNDAGSSNDEVESMLDRLGYMQQRISANAQRWEVDGFRGAVEKLHGEALKRLIAVLRQNPAGEAIIEQAATDEVVYTVLRQHGIIEPSIEWRVERALQRARPQLATHGGDMTVAAVAPPQLTLHLSGSCESCPAQTLTLRSLVAGALKRDCPEIKEIVIAEDPKTQERPITLENEGWRPAGLLSEIPESGARDFVVEREGLLLVRRGDTVKCYGAYCPHRGIIVDTRDIEEDGLLTCYRHGYRFDLDTGECLTAPGLNLETHEVSIVDGKVMVRMPVVR